MDRSIDLAVQHSHIDWHLFNFSTRYVFKCILKLYAPEDKQLRGHFLAFLRGKFSNVFSNPLLKMSCSHIGCSCLIFCQYVFSNVFSKSILEKKDNCTLVYQFLHYVFSNSSSNGLHERRHSYIGCIYMVFLHCVFSVRLQIFPQTGSVKG